MKKFDEKNWSAFISSDLRLAVFDKKINGGDIDSFVVIIGWGKPLHFYEKYEKRPSLDAPAPTG